MSFLEGGSQIPYNVFCFLSLKRVILLWVRQRGAKTRPEEKKKITDPKLTIGLDGEQQQQGADVRLQDRGGSAAAGPHDAATGWTAAQESTETIAAF